MDDLFNESKVSNQDGEEEDDSIDPVLARRIRELDEKEQRLIEIENELDEFESEVKQDSKGVRLPKNWPCRNTTFAIARHDISVDIPNKFQSSVKKFYALWILTCLSTLWNWFAMLFWANQEGVGFKDYLVATLYVVVGLPYSWIFWYKRYYRGMQNGGAISSLFFIFLLMHMVWCGIMAVGMPLTSSSGFLVMTKLFVDGHGFGGGMCLISGVIWSLNAIFTAYLMKIAHYNYGLFLAQKYSNYGK